ncbi:MAG TPA: hypothetical protein VGR28_06150 [Candidatus Thermoplasmatota archaeon]|jgi:hypothetical protein|nr:hypothetical protein [Candidatus Thermoplasmatota archaeon]
MADKEPCDLCGKEVGVAAIYRRIGFVAGARASKVCGSCYADKLHREERLRFAKGSGKPRKKAGDADEGMGGSSALDELRGLG